MLRYAITPGKLASEPAGSRRSAASLALVARCHQLADDGVDFVLVREKDLAAGELTALVRSVVSAAQGSGMRVLVAQCVDVALAAGAAGVHLASAVGQLTVGQVRRIMPEAFVSVSCHTVGEILRARAGGADATLFAPVFGKSVDGKQVVEGSGLDALRLAVQTAGELSVFALGGVTANDFSDCRAAGAAGVAGIRLFFGDTTL